MWWSTRTWWWTWRTWWPVLLGTDRCSRSRWRSRSMRFPWTKGWRYATVSRTETEVCVILCDFRTTASYRLIPGEKGGEGSEGPPGENGSIGRPGQRGEPGKPGKRGVPGPAGQSGRCGRPGARGETGAAGIPGPFGSPGNTGPAGTGIETQQYYQKYKAILRKQMEDALDKVSIRLCFGVQTLNSYLK